MGEKRLVEVQDAVKLEEAYNDLTREAFAVWIRLMVEPDHVLERAGMWKIAEKCNYGKRQFSNILRQLRNKGYLRYRSTSPGVPVKLHVAKRPMLIGFDRFVKLS